MNHINPNIAGSNLRNKLKSRTFWLAFMGMAVSAIPLLKADDEYIGPALLGYAAVIGAVAGLNAFNKQQERLIQMKSGNTFFTEDTRGAGDTNVISGLTGNVTKI